MYICPRDTVSLRSPNSVIGDCWTLHNLRRRVRRNSSNMRILWICHSEHI